MCLCRGTLHWKGTLLQGWGHHLLRDTLLQGDSIAGDTLLQRDTPQVWGHSSAPQSCSMVLRWKQGSPASESPQLVRKAEKEKQK